MVDATCPTTPLGRSVCAQQLINESAKTGVEIHVSTLPPLIRGPWENAGFRCQHGVEYWIAPTGEQITQWLARWRKRRACFHHDHATGESWVTGRLVDLGRAKHWSCSRCGRYWT